MVDISVNKMNESLSGVVDSVSGLAGPWGTIVLAVISIGAGIFTAMSYWRKFSLGGAETDARINSLSDLQEIIAAERLENASLKKENQELKERADRFAAERNELYVKMGEMSGEIRALKQEVEGLKRVITKGDSNGR